VFGVLDRFLQFALGQRLHAAAPGGDVPRAATLGRALLRPLIAGIRVNRFLLAVQQLVHFGHIAHVGRCRGHRVHQTRLHIHANVGLHAEVPLLLLLRLVHGRIALPVFVLRRGRRRDDRGVHDRALAQEQALAAQVRVDRFEHLRGQAVLLQEATELQDRRLVGNRVLVQL